MLHNLVRTYARAFLSQSVGIVGLLWCLFDGHAGTGLLLGILVLADQAMFLNRRFGRASSRPPSRLLSIFGASASA